jgi:hypothetical protein
MRNSLRALPAIFVLLAAACGSQPAAPSARPPASANVDAAGIVWLCRPDLADTPCTGDLSTTVVDSSGGPTVSRPEVAKDPPIDCFYVYPTTSRQSGMNATLTIDPEERGVAVAQAALFSQVCSVYAPIYPQLTGAALNSGRITLDNLNIAFEGVRDAFSDYMANYNHGRGIVFIGHSQGAMLLANLLNREVDPDAKLRKLLVSALLMGANVTVAAGKTAGGDFINIPACESTTQTGCVVAYSSFESTPPQPASFGRVQNALRMLEDSKTGPQQILCVNPAAPGGGVAALHTTVPTGDLTKLAGAPKPLPTTAYTSYQNAFSGECKTSGDASWLEIARTGPADSTPAFAGSEGPGWGLHDHDVALALGSLVDLVRTQAAAFH